MSIDLQCKENLKMSSKRNRKLLIEYLEDYDDRFRKLRI